MTERLDSRMKASSRRKEKTFGSVTYWIVADEDGRRIVLLPKDYKYLEKAGADMTLLDDIGGQDSRDAMEKVFASCTNLPKAYYS